MPNPIDFHPTGDVKFDTLMHEVNAEIMATNDLLLPDEMVISAVTRACQFFNLPEVPVIEADGTCVWPNDTTTPNDDVFGFNRVQLMELGISGEDSLTLIYTHECAHRTLQNTYNDSWEEELACDFFAGVHAGLHKINIDNFEAALGATMGGASHPAGALRAEFIEYGQQIAAELNSRGVEITYDGCIERLNDHLAEKEGLINEYRQRCDSASDSLTDDLIAYGGVANDNINIDVDSSHADISSGETLGSTALVEQTNLADDDVENLTFRGHTRAEIDRKIAEAKRNERYYKSQAEHELYMARHSTDNAGRQFHTSNANGFLRQAQEWHEKVVKWEHTEPDNNR